MQGTQTDDTWSSSSEEVLNKCFPLHRACRDGDLQHLGSLLSSGNYNIYQEDDFYGWTPIHWAAYFGKLSCLLLLQENNICIDAITERLNQSPTHIVAYGGHATCLKWLLQHGSLINRQDYMGETPLHKAARTGSMECISLLVSQGGSLSLKNYSGLNASQVARQANHIECANYLDRALQLQQQTKDSDQTRGTPDGQPASSQPHFISTNTYHSNPHFITHNNTPTLSNGQSHDNNNQSEDCDMEMDAGIGGSNMADNMAASGDVLLDQGVTRNIIPVAGRKREREESENDCYKRARNDEPSVNRSKLNGWLQNNSLHIAHELTNQEILSSHMSLELSNEGSLSNHMTHLSFEQTNQKANQMAAISQSMVEHSTSVVLQQGYDSLMLDSLIAECHGS